MRRTTRPMTSNSRWFFQSGGVRANRGYSKANGEEPGSDVELNDDNDKPPISNGFASERCPKDAPLRSALRLAGLYFAAAGPQRRRALFLAFVVLAMLLAETWAGLAYSGVQRDFMTALQAKNVEKFYLGLWTTGGLILLLSPIIAVHRYSAGALKMHWRAFLTQRFARSYLSGSDGAQSAFYRLMLTSDIDNPDQRICQDVSDFVETMYSITQDLISTAMSVMGFSTILYKISPMVCVCTVLYAAMGTFITAFGFGPGIVRCQGQLVQQEASLRYVLIRTRENAESIAFFRGGGAEWSNFQRLFGNLLETLHRLIMIDTGLGTFNQCFQWATFAVVPLIVGGRYLRGEVEFGTLAQVSMAFSVILRGLTVVMTRLDTLTGFTVRVRRLEVLENALLAEEQRVKSAQGFLLRAAGSAYAPLGKSSWGHISSEPLEGHFEAAMTANVGGPPFAAAAADCLGAPSAASSSSSLEPVVLKLEGVTLQTPPRAHSIQQTLVSNLSLVVGEGDSLLIAGPSGVGKSSLLRAFAGLWTDGGGRIRLNRSRCFFMPQRPYMFLGSLREQLLYPQVASHALPDAALCDVLRLVDLGYLLDRHPLSDTKDWSSILSLGEQQRINFARAFLRTDLQLALIDEGTSACDPQNEANLYKLLGHRLKSYISIGHRPALRKYHKQALWLKRRPEASEPGPQSSDPPPALLLPMPDFEREHAEWVQGQATIT